MSEKIVCPQCKNVFDKSDPQKWVCGNCGFTVPLAGGKPVFSGHPDDQIPQEKIERGAEKGTAWRQFNWQFITAVASSLPEGADVLDVGAGRGDFKAIFSRQAYLGLDIYPYTETDLSVDLIEVCPFKPASFDLIVLANVLEHVYEYRKLVSVCAALLKPRGKLLVTVPFLLKLHQEPVDFHRYTRYTLENMAAENGLEIETLDGYYNPIALLNEGIGNAWQYGIPQTRGINRLVAKLLIFMCQNSSDRLAKLIGNGIIRNALQEENPNILGYQLLMRRPGENLV